MSCKKIVITTAPCCRVSNKDSSNASVLLMSKLEAQGKQRTTLEFR